MLDEQIAVEEAEFIFGLLGLRNKNRGILCHKSDTDWEYFG